MRVSFASSGVSTSASHRLVCRRIEFEDQFIDPETLEERRYLDESDVEYTANPMVKHSEVRMQPNPLLQNENEPGLAVQMQQHQAEVEAAARAEGQPEEATATEIVVCLRVSLVVFQLCVSRTRALFSSTLVLPAAPLVLSLDRDNSPHDRFTSNQNSTENEVRPLLCSITWVCSCSLV